MTTMTLQELETPNTEFAQILASMLKNGVADTSAPPFDFDLDLAALRAAGAPEKPSPLWDGVLEEDVKVPVRDGSSIDVRIYRPETARKGSPLLVMYHGGGYCLGTMASEEETCRYWTSEFGGVAVNILYRHAPEFKFPTAVYDAYDSLKWAAVNAESLGADPAKGFVVGGTSAGATIASVVTHQYCDEVVSPAITGSYLSVSMEVDGSAVPEKYQSQFRSWEGMKDAPIIPMSLLRKFNAKYEPDRSSPFYSPLLWPTGHAKIPPTYFQACGMDPLRDGTLIYEKVLREECGIKTKLDVFPGLIHGFWAMFPQAEFTADWKNKAHAGFRSLLFGEEQSS